VRPGDAVPDLDAAIEAYLTYLHVERGLAPATIRAYRGDLADFAASRGTTAAWARSPDAVVGYRAARTRRGRPRDPGLAPTSLRRRAAALKGFYRFAYGEGTIAVDVAAHLDLPRPQRLLPETLTVDETERLLEAAGGDDAGAGDANQGPAGEDPHALRDRALLELLYAAGLRISEAIGLDRDDLSVDGAFVRVSRQALTTGPPGAASWRIVTSRRSSFPETIARRQSNSSVAVVSARRSTTGANRCRSASGESTSVSEVNRLTVAKPSSRSPIRTSKALARSSDSMWRGGMVARCYRVRQPDRRAIRLRRESWGGPRRAARCRRAPSRFPSVARPRRTRPAHRRRRSARPGSRRPRSDR